MFTEVRPTGADDQFGIWERCPSIECLGRLQLRVVPGRRPAERSNLGRPEGEIVWQVITPDRHWLFESTEKDHAFNWAYDYLRKKWYGEVEPSMARGEGFYG